MSSTFLNMSIFIIVVLYYQSLFKLLIAPWFGRQDRTKLEPDVLLYPLRSFLHQLKSSELNLSRDLSSLLFIICYQASLFILAEFKRESVIEIGLAIFFLYILMAMVSIARTRLTGNKRELDRSLIAAIQLSIVVCSIGILQKFYFAGNESIWAQGIINFYAFVLLITGLSLTKAVSPELEGKTNIYQQIEKNLAALTWICIFVASVSPDDKSRFEFASFFMFKILIVVSIFVLRDFLISEKSRRLQEEWVYKFAIPIGVVSIFGIWVGASYV